jgi:SurA-like protein
MSAKRSKFVVLMSLLLFSCAARAGEVIDAIVATVNGHIILLSDWDDAVRLEAFLNAHPLEQLKAEDRKSALDHLIDQELLREQLPHSATYITQEELAERIAQIRRLYPAAKTDLAWRAVLSQYGITQTSLEGYLEMQINLMRQVDTRFRPSVDIDSRSIESYYNQELLPQLRQAGTGDVPMAEAIARIKELLTQRKMSEMLTAWLQNLRAGSDIHSDLTSSHLSEQSR